MSEIDGIRTGITSSSITVFTTFLSTLLVEDELTTIFAATFSVMLANGISDAFAVGTSLKDGIDLTRDRLLVRDIIVSELIYTFPIVVFVGILAILQRKKHRIAKRTCSRLYWSGGDRLHIRSLLSGISGRRRSDCILQL